VKQKSKGSGRREPGKDRIAHWLGLQREYIHDTYKSRKKMAEPTVCPRCGAVFHKGHWTWRLRPAKAQEAVCPACRRIEDNYPAGILTLSGSFLRRHREELLNVVRRNEKLAQKQHPLCRIIGIKEAKGKMVVTTTDKHLPRRIGEALWHAYHGELKLHYAEDARLIRMTWTR